MFEVAGRPRHARRVADRSHDPDPGADSGSVDEEALLAEVFLAYLGPAERGKLSPAGGPGSLPPGDLVAGLARCVSAARAEWPDLATSAEILVRFLAAQVAAAALADAPALAAWLEQLPAGELYLAAACAHGEPRALQAFEARFFGEVAVAVRKLRAPADLDDELAQVLRRKLFVAEPEQPPLIAEFSGRGSLRGWFRVVTLRTAIDLLRQSGREQADSADDLGALPAPEADPELALLRRHYAAAFQSALAAAVAELEPAERNLLRQHFVDRLTLAELAALHRVHRITVFRRVDRARQQLIDRTRVLLGERLSGVAGREELQSVLRVLQSQLDLSLGGVLAR
jgi:RNA polymerase sigma-70 factor (ECF subfamily)